MVRLVILVSFLLKSGLLAAQLQATLGQNLNGQNWQELKMPHMNLIFPAGREDVAQRVANLVRYQADSLSGTIGPKLNKPNMVLQNHTVVSNGFVGLSPFRTEFFTTPPASMQVLGSMDWLDVLTVHEYRHIQQLSNYQYGATKVLTWLYGQNGWGTGISLSIPNWFAEGDAVWAETKFTKSGRGRTPFFTKEQRALALANKKYRYQKFRNGSLKDQLPNHYPTGYLMTTHLRNERGVDIWNRIIIDASAYTSIFYPFSRSLKRHTGYNTSALFKKSWNTASEEWISEQNVINRTSSTVISPDRKTVTRYFFPQQMLDGSVVVWKRDFRNTDQIVKIIEGKEEVLFSPGFNVSSQFNHKNGTFVWTEFSQNPRRSNESFSDLYYWNDIEKERVRVTTDGKYFSPVLVNGEKALVVDYPTSLKPSIKMVDLKTSELETIIEYEKDTFLGRIAFSPETNSCIAIHQSESQLSIIKIDLETKEIVPLTPKTRHVLDAVHVSGEFVYFSSSISGIDNIYRVSMDGSKRIEQITSVEVGAYDPSVSADGRTLFFTTFDEMGHKVNEMPVPNIPSPVRITEPHRMTFLDQTPSLFVDEEDIFTLTDSVEYEVNDYSMSPFNGLSLHSWFIDPLPIAPGAFLFMNNYLNDISIVAGGGYNINERGAYFQGTISYARFFPVISIEVSQNYRSASYLTSADTLATQDFTETQLSTSVSVPMQWLNGNYASTFNSQIGYDYHITSNRTLENDLKLQDKNFSTLSGEISWRTVRRRARQNIAPRYGISLSAQLVENLSIGSNRKFFGRARIYLPGLFKNHTLQLSGGYQYEPLTNRFQEVDLFQYSRGFNMPANDKFTRLSVDYGFPLFYPDLGFVGITYFKRIRTNWFFDLGRAKIDQLSIERDFQSLGGELIFDNTFFNLSPLISIGVRGSYLLTTDPSEPERDFAWGIFFIGEF